MTHILPRATRRATAVLAGLALIPLAGCGGDEAAGSGAGDGLARLAPPTSPFYLQATLRPDGKQKADLDALVAKLSPGRSVEQLVAGVFDDSGKVDFKRDVEPWLGKHAAVTVTGLPAGQGEKPDVAGIVETTDADQALATFRKDATGRVQERSYDGVTYLTESGAKPVGGIVDDTLVIGTEPAFKAVVDASKGKGLDTNPAFTKVVDAVDDDALGFGYGDVRRAFDLLAASGRGGVKQLESARELVNRQGLTTVAAALVVTPNAVRIRAAAPAKDDAKGGGAADTVAGLPAGSWAALGLGDLGSALTQSLDGLGSAGGPGSDVQGGLDQLEQQSGIDVRKDLLSWMGQAGVFVRGTSLTDIGGALVVQSKDPAATKAALAKARTLATNAGLQAKDLTGKGIDDGFSVAPDGLPVDVFAALAGDRFVLAVNRTALDEALDPATKLQDDDAFKAAADALGDGLRPAFYLDVPKIAGFIGLAAGGQPGYAKVKPYLDKVTTVVAGTKRDGDLRLAALAVGVR